MTARASGGAAVTRGSGRGERLVFVTVDTLHAILADYTPHGDVPAASRPVALQRHPATGLLALVIEGGDLAIPSAIRVTVRAEGASSLNVDVARSDDTDGLGAAQRRVLFAPEDALRMVRFVTGGAIPAGAELRNVAVSARLARMIALSVYADWRDFTWDGRSTTPSADVPFGIDVRYERGSHDDRVVVFDERGTPVRRSIAPDKAQ